MKRITLAASLLIAPALVQAQGGVQAQSQTTVDASARGTKNAQGSASVTSSTTADAAARGGSKLSADAQAKVDADVRAARERKLPEAPIRRRAAEGQAKGASDAQIVAASGRTLVDLQTSFDAMARGGHSRPSDEEISRGAQLLARGYTSVQLEGIARKAPSDRSLVVAFETLTSLQAEGKSSARALAQVESLLEARASDAQLRGLAARGDAAAGLGGAVSVGRGATVGGGAASAAAGAGRVAGSAAAGAGAAATGGLTTSSGGAQAGVTGAVSGTVGGALGRKP